jgi:3-oxoacyl-[acyl-carrier-protein] synthase-3
MTTYASGRAVKTHGAEVAGIVSCVPKRVVDNQFFIEKFGEESVSDVVKMIGVNSRRWVAEESTTSDLCAEAGRALLTKLGWKPQSVDAVIFVSQTPDFRLPASACVLQNKLGISVSCIAFDVNLGCSGYPYALWLGMTMIQSGAAKRVLLAVGDTISKLVDSDDRATAMLFGDAGTVTALQVSQEEGLASFILGTDGRGAENLIVPEGAFRACSSDVRLEGRNSDCLFMDGGEIFNFTLKSVPPLVADLMDFSGNSVESIDYFLFHQANQFMLKHLAKKSKIPLNRFPINIDRYGNTSSASIPLLLSSDLESLKLRSHNLALFGFGVGYSWGAANIAIGPINVLDVIEL